MRRVFSKIYQDSVFSILLLAAPYIFSNFYNFYNSLFFSWAYFFATLLFLIFLQFLITLLSESKNIISKIIIIIFYISILVILYGGDIVNFINQIQTRLFGIQKIRGRIQLLFITGLLFYLFLFNYLRSIRFSRFINLFFGLLSVITLLFSIDVKYNVANNRLLNNYKEINAVKNKNKTTILIIVDEYSSPVELSKHSSNDNFSLFGNMLKERGFYVKEKFYSAEISTIHSLGSLFNFNLSSNHSFSKTNIEALIENQFTNSTLADSLLKKRVDLVNYGIFDFGKSQPISRAYFYPRNYFEVLMRHSILSAIGFSYHTISEFGASFYLPTKHSQTVFYKFKESSLDSKKAFVYAHLFMPHSPFSFGDEFKSRPITTDNYISFWNFTNSKVLPLLDSLISDNKYKVIITGDHGYRSDSLINPHFTFAAFYGFEDNSLKMVNSVQDLGSLINGQFEY